MDEWGRTGGNAELPAVRKARPWPRVSGRASLVVTATFRRRKTLFEVQKLGLLTEQRDLYSPIPLGHGDGFREGTARRGGTEHETCSPGCSPETRNSQLEIELNGAAEPIAPTRTTAFLRPRHVSVQVAPTGCPADNQNIKAHLRHWHWQCPCVILRLGEPQAEAGY